MLKNLVFRFWCPTAIDAHGYALKGRWGYCADTCPAATILRVQSVSALLRTVGHYRQVSTANQTTAACYDQAGKAVACTQDPASLILGESGSFFIQCYFTALLPPPPLRCGKVTLPHCLTNVSYLTPPPHSPPAR